MYFEQRRTLFVLQLNVADYFDARNRRPFEKPTPARQEQPVRPSSQTGHRQDVRSEEGPFSPSSGWSTAVACVDGARFFLFPFWQMTCGIGPFVLAPCILRNH